MRRSRRARKAQSGQGRSAQRASLSLIGAAPRGLAFEALERRTLLDGSVEVNLSATIKDSTGGLAEPPASTAGQVAVGEIVTYTITVSNSNSGAGIHDASGVTVSINVTPTSALTAPSYSAAAMGNATSPVVTGGTASGDSIVDQNVSLPVGSEIVYTLTGTVNPAAVHGIQIQAVVSPPPNEFNQSTGGPYSATLTDTFVGLPVTMIDSGGGNSATGNVGAFTPGGNLTYTVIVSNPNQGTVVGATVQDAFDSDFTGESWTVTTAGGATSSAAGASGSGNIADTVNLPNGSAVTYTVTATVSASKTGTLTNTANVMETNGVGTVFSSSATDHDAIPVALMVTEGDDHHGNSTTNTTGTVVAGSSLIYTVVASNIGSTAVANVMVADTFPPNLTGAAYKVTTAGGAMSSVAGGSGSGNIADTVTLPVGGAITYTVTGIVSSTATGTLTNTASVTPPSGSVDVTPANDTATDSDLIVPVLTIAKSDNVGGSSVTGGTGTVAPGGTVTYTIVVANPATTTLANTAVVDDLPPGVTGDSYTATASGSASGYTSSGSGNISDTVTFPPGSAVTYTVTATVSSAATGTLSNTATATLSGGASVTATDTDGISGLPVTKTDSGGGSSTTGKPGTVAPGGNLTYTITVSNPLATTLTGVTIAESLPSGFTQTSSSLPAGAVTISPSSTVSYTVAGIVSPTATGTLTNTASVTVPAGQTDAGTSSVTDTDTINGLPVTKTDSGGGSSATGHPGTVAPGGNLTYTITVTNPLATTLTGVTISDNLPSSFTQTSSSFPAGSVTLSPSSTVSYTIAGTVSPTATGTLTNTASVTVPAGQTDTGTSSVTDTDTINGLPVTKTDSGGGSSVNGHLGTVAPGGNLTYTITVTNPLATTLTGVIVTDNLPSGFTQTSSSLPAGAVTLSPSSTVSYTIVGTVSPTATGTLTNTAGVTVPAGQTDAGTSSATDTDTISGLPVTKTDSGGGSSTTGHLGTVAPGGSLTYTITVTNPLATTLTGVIVTDSVPSGFTQASSSLPAGAVTLSPSSTVSYTIAGTVSPAATGTLTNTASVTVPAGQTDTGTSSVTDTDTINGLPVTKTDSGGGSSVNGHLGTVAPGGNLTYTITASNPLATTLTGVIVTDSVLSGFTQTSSSLPAGSVTLSPGSTVTYTLAGTVSPTATGTLTNTATVTVPAGQTDAGTSTATDADTISGLPVTKTDSGGGSSATGKSGTVAPGGNLSYTITVTNPLATTLTGVTVTDNLPSGFTQTSSSLPAGAVTLSPSTTVTYTLAGTVSPTATGTLTNTASVTVPAGQTDAGTSSATDTDTISGLPLTKTDSGGGSSVTGHSGTVIAGENLTYTVTVNNPLATTLTGITVTDSLPAGFTRTSSSLPAGPVTLAPSTTVSYTIVGTVSSTATGTLTNTASVTVPAGQTDPGANSATDIDTVANLTITAGDSAGARSAPPGTTGTIVAGSMMTYTVAVGNSGTSPLSNVAVSDDFAPDISADNWTASNGHSGNGNISDNVSLAANSTINYTVTASVSASATGTLTNTASAALSSGANISATDNDSITRQADLAVTDTDNSPKPGSVVPGTTLTYTVVVSNIAGPSDVNGAGVHVAIPASLTNAVYTKTLSSGGGAAPAVLVSAGAIADTVDLPAGSSVTYSINGTVTSSATGTLTNTAAVTAPSGVTDPSPGNDSATDTDTLTPQAMVTIAQSDDRGGSVVAGTELTYLIVARNDGPSDVPGATIADTLPPDFAETSSTPVMSGGASIKSSAGGGGNIHDTVNLPASGSITYVVSGTVSSSASGTLSNTAALTLPPSVQNGGVSPILPATDTDNITQQVNLTIAKSDNDGGNSATGATGTAVSGTSLMYTITVNNRGPSEVKGATIMDSYPPGFTVSSLTPSFSGGALITASAGAGGNISDTATLPVGGEITYTVTGTVGLSAPATLTNTANVEAPPGVTNTGQTKASDSDTVVAPPVPAITESDNSGGTVTAGGTITYTIVVNNLSTLPLTGAAIADSFITSDFTNDSYTASGSGGAGGYAPSGNGDIHDLNVDLPANSSITYKVAATVSSAVTGTLTNTATITPSKGAPIPATDNDAINHQADIAITTSDNAGGSSVTSTAGSVAAGSALAYTITVSNAGPSDASGATVADTLPAGFVSISTKPVLSNGASITASVGTGGNIEDTVNLPAGSSITYVATGTVSSSSTGTLTESATVTAPTGTRDPVLTNNSAADKDTITQRAGLVITNSDNAGGNSASDATGSVVASSVLDYTITVSNAGPSDLTGATFTDTLPTGLNAVTYTATETGGATGFKASGSGAINDTLTLPAHSSITYAVFGTVDPSAATLSNTAALSPPAGLTISGNTSATDNDNVKLGIASLKAVPVVVTEGVSVAKQEVATFAGTGAAPTASDFKATIDWGDGSTSAGTIVAGSSEFSVVGNHSYVSPGYRSLMVTVVPTGDASQQVPTTAKVGSPTELFVAQVYRDMLHREVEPQGLQFWTSMVDGGLSRQEAVIEFQSSPEFRDAVVRGLYQLYLHRAPEAAAVSYFSHLLLQNTPEQIAAMLAVSNEYLQSSGGGTGTGWLNAFYNDALNRNPDSSALQTLGKIDFTQPANRVKEIDSIFGSPEYLGDLVRFNFPDRSPKTPFGFFEDALDENGKSESYPFGFYEDYLGRVAEDYAVGNLTAEMQAGQPDSVIISQILASDEYFARAATQPG